MEQAKERLCQQGRFLFEFQMAPTCLFDLRSRSSNTHHTGWESAGNKWSTDPFVRNRTTLSEIGGEGVCYCRTHS